MALDLTNSNKLDESFSGLDITQISFKTSSPIIDYIPTALPSGDRLEDDFGGASNYVPADQMQVYQPVSPNVYSVGNQLYESTPYGYYLSFSGEGTSFFTDEEKVTNFIDEELGLFTAEGDEFSNFRLFGIGKLSDKQKQRRDKIKKKFKDIGDDIKNSKAGKLIGDKLGGGKAVHAANKFNPAFVTMRGAMLSVLKKNVVGMADAMAIIKEKSPNKRWEEIMQKWWMFGGMKSKFDKAVMQGKGKKPLFKEVLDKFQKKKGFDGNYSNAEGADNAAKAVLITSGLLGVAAPILAAIPATQAASLYVGSAAGGFGAMGGIIKGFAKDEGATDQQIASANVPDKEVPNTPLPTDEKELEKLVDKSDAEDEGTFLGMPKAVGITVAVVGGLALIVGSIFLVKKFKK